MKVVIDCNVLISAGLKDGVCRRLVLEVLKNSQIYYSKEIAAEYYEVMLRSHFKLVKEIQNIIDTVLNIGTLIDPMPCPYKLFDPDDEIYLAAALTSKSDFLITGNIKHFPFDQYDYVKIISPRQILDLF